MRAPPSWLTPECWSSERRIRKPSTLMLEVRDALSCLGHMSMSGSIWMMRFPSNGMRSAARVAHTYTHFDTYSRPRQVQLRRRLVRGRAHQEEAPGPACIRLFGRVGGQRRGRPAVPEKLGYWGDIRARFEKAYQGAPDAECGHSARFVRIAKTQHRHRGRARSAQAHRCPCHPCAARAGATPWVPPPSAAAVAAGRSSTRGLDERAPARVSRPRVKPFLDRVFGLASRNHCC